MKLSGMLPLIPPLWQTLCLIFHISLLRIHYH